MKFFRHINQGKLYSFGDDIQSVPILNKDLGTYQREIIEKLGGELIDISNVNDCSEEENYFLFEDDLFFSEEFLEKCISKAKSTAKVLRFCVANNSFNERFCLPSGNEDGEYYNFGLWYHGSKLSEEKSVIHQDILEYFIELPDQIVQGRKYHMDISDTYAIHIISPFHLLMVNMAMNLLRTFKVRSRIKPRYLKLFGLNLNNWIYRGMKRMNKIGKNTNIHPSAIIEGSIIEDNVKVGANSIIRMSHVSAGSYISDNVCVINSVLGRNSFIANSNYINTCLTFEEVFLIHGPYQLSVFGKNSACFAVINCDIRLDQKNIKIQTSKGLIDSRQPLLGIAYGHRAKVGGGNIIAAGRTVPNDVHINPPDNIIMEFEKK